MWPAPEFVVQARRRARRQYWIYVCTIGGWILFFIITPLALALWAIALWLWWLDRRAKAS
jgi:hypothetical protein